MNSMLYNNKYLWNVSLVLLTAANSSNFRKDSSVNFDYPEMSFEEKKERLKDVLFGDKNISKENVDTPIKGKYNFIPLRKINLLYVF